MAKLLGITCADYQAIAKLPVARLGESAAHPMWHTLADCVDSHIAGLTAIRRVLREKSHIEHVERMKRRARLVGN